MKIGRKSSDSQRRNNTHDQAAINQYYIAKSRYYSTNLGENKLGNLACRYISKIDSPNL